MITIETVNYFGNKGKEYNANVLYRKNGKLHLCRVHIDFFNERVYVPKQEKDAKALAGFGKAINDFAVKSNFLFN
jgi:hypothetical protein